MRTLKLIPILLCLAAAGCTTYAPVPLPTTVDLAPALPMGTPPTLDMNSVAAVALIDNPDLRAARQKAKVSDAQLYAAGILPNPQLDSNLDIPTNQGPEAGNGFGFGLTYDIQALITQPARLASASAARDQAQLDLLWQEWQTVAQARLLYTQRINAAEKQSLYSAISAQYSAQSMRTSQALQRGDVTFDESGVDLAALLDAQSQLSAVERAASQADYSLRTLLGLTPQVAIPLQPIDVPPIPDRTALEAALAKVAEVRPDLRALQDGYRSQEQTVREAVLAQFPSLSLGITRASDTPGDRSDVGHTVHWVSLGATLNLPLFDRNQGVIAVQRATRAQLRAEYQARLDQATGDAWRLWAEMQELDAAMKDVEARLPDLQAGADNAQRAYLAGNLPALTYVTLEGALVARQVELSDYKQALWSDAIALSSIIGTQVEPDLGMKEAMQ
jgi:outer membrane protein, multidrug efflux system